MRDDERWVDLATFDTCQKAGQVLVHVGLPHLEGEALGEGGTVWGGQLTTKFVVSYNIRTKVMTAELVSSRTTCRMVAATMTIMMPAAAHGTSQGVMRVPPGASVPGRRHLDDAEEELEPNGEHRLHLLDHDAGGNRDIAPWAGTRLGAEPAAPEQGVHRIISGDRGGSAILRRFPASHDSTIPRPIAVLRTVPGRRVSSRRRRAVPWPRRSNAIGLDDLAVSRAHDDTRVGEQLQVTDLNLFHTRVQCDKG